MEKERQSQLMWEQSVYTVCNKLPASLLNQKTLPRGIEPQLHQTRWLYCGFSSKYVLRGLIKCFTIYTIYIIL